MSERTKSDLKEVILRSLEHDVGVSPEALDVIGAALDGAKIYPKHKSPFLGGGLSCWEVWPKPVACPRCAGTGKQYSDGMTPHSGGDCPACNGTGEASE